MHELREVSSTSRKSVWILPMSTSIEKMAAAIGALKVAAIPPAAPQVTSVRTFSEVSRLHWPTVEPIADPICTIGPSRPAAPPNPIVSDDAITFTVTTRFRIRPPLVASAVMTSGTPCPLASRAKKCTSGPTHKPPRAGSSTSCAGPNRDSSAATGPRAKSATISRTWMKPTEPRPVNTPTTTDRMMR